MSSAARPLLTEDANGVYSIFTTPFDDDETLDLDAVGPMMEFYRDAGCRGVTLLGVMGEAPKMSSAEIRALLAESLRHSGEMTVLVGLGAMGPAPFVEQSAALMELGAHGVMINAPGTIRTDADGAAYFINIGRKLGDIPFVLQDFPLATGVHLPVQTLEAVRDACDNLKMIKMEDWPCWSKLDHIRGSKDRDTARRISVLSGFGALYFPEDLQHGVDGVMTGFSFPEMLVAVVAAHARGDIRRMYDVFDAFAPIVRVEMSLGTGLAVRKHILHRRGVLPTARIRFPGAALTPRDAALIDALLERLQHRCAEIGFPMSLRHPESPNLYQLKSKTI